MPWNRAVQLIDQAEDLSDKGLHDTAHDLLRKALALAPQHPGAHALLALNTWRQDKGREAYRIVKIALELGPDWPYVHYVAGMICLSLSDTVSAEKHFREGIHLNNEYPSNFLGMADLYVQMEKPNKALKYLDQALALSPENVYALTTRGKILLDQGRAKAAELEAARALEINPEDYTACMLMGEIRFAQRNLSESRELAILALQQFPKDEHAISLLVRIKSQENPMLKIFWFLMRTVCFTASRFKTVTKYFLIITTVFAFTLYRHSFGTEKILILAYIGLVIGSAVVIGIGMLVIEAMIRREMRSVEIDGDF